MAETVSWLEQQKSLWRRELGSLERVLNEVIENAARELKKKDEEYRNALHERDEQYRVISNRISEEVIKNGRLSEQNSYLRNRLQKLDPKSSSMDLNLYVESNAASDQAGNNPTVAVGEYHHLVEKYNDLHKMYQDSLKKLKYLERKNINVMQKNKEMKESVLAWQQFSERHRERQKLKSEEKTRSDNSRPGLSNAEDGTVSAPPSPKFSVARTPRPLFGLDASSPASGGVAPRTTYSLDDGTPGQHTVATNSATILNTKHISKSPTCARAADLELPIDPVSTANDEIPPSPNTRIGQSGTEKINSSQTTEDESEVQAGEKTQNLAICTAEDDIPHFVSERSLKRKRVPDPKTGIHTDRVDGTPIRPFRVKEEPRSSPPLESTSHALVRKETLDLDELGPTVLLTQLHPMPSSKAVATLRHQRSLSVPLLKEEPAGECDLLQDIASEQHRVQTGNELLNDESRAFSEPNENILLDRHALRPMDPNSRNGNVDEGAPSKRLRRDQNRKFKDHHKLIESSENLSSTHEKDEDLTSNATRTRPVSKMKQKQAHVNGARHLPKTPAAGMRRFDADLPTPPTRKIGQSSRPKLPMGSPAQSHSDRSTVSGTPRAAVSKPQLHTPLRSKPVSELRLSDFKPNPAYNQGYSYAFRETIRKRSDRACLPGCTRPECCGSAFRALAEAAPPLLAAEEGALLEDYLGDAHDADEIKRMLPDERRELILQARTRAMANKHGKHRQMYERAKSPPGFWRIDFPTTQEQQEDREKALQLEREQIQERLFEAMRKGGKYVFRDE